MNLKLKIKILERYPSQVAFAFDLGLDPTELSKFIRGWRQPKPEIQDLIVERLGCSKSEIFPPNN